MKHTISIYHEEGIKKVDAEDGAKLLDVLRGADIAIESPCGGKGICGKCIVKIEGSKQPASEKEKQHLGDESIKAGYRLACMQTVKSDINVFVENKKGSAKIITEGIGQKVKLEPFISKKYIKLKEPDLEDQSADLQRVADELEKNKITNDIHVLRKLADTVREKEYEVTLLLGEGELIGIEPGDTSDVFYGMAVDIGTTTIAAYLYDLKTGKQKEVASVLNPQRKFGADIISRIEHTISSKTGLEEIHKEIKDCINDIAGDLCKKAAIMKHDIYSAVFAGNTTMMHFLMKLPAKNMAVSPFIPVTTGSHRFKAGELAIDINKEGLVFIMPSVSSYIGADTVAAVLASGIYKKPGRSLLIDIGTNGEIVLSDGKNLYSCSTAAGPAFEGANISNGMGGIDGAIDSVWIEDGIKLSVLGGVKPQGICGSGLVDAIACMLELGVMDETGRILDVDELSGAAKKYSDRFYEANGMRSFVLFSEHDGNKDSIIAITQKDIRELQNAKAAIAAGINVLASKAGIVMEDIDKVYLAGGFGSYINKKSAVAIGMIPKQLEEKIESVGNASGAGAIQALLSKKMLKKSDEIKNRIRYIELSASSEFTEAYIDNMLFPERS